MSAKVYEIITQKIIDALETETPPWRKPWASREQASPRNLASGKGYRGINRFLLSLSNFDSPYFVTYKQAQARGGSVRKGEKGLPVIFFSKFEKDSAKAPGTTDQYFCARYYTVFNVAQCEGLDVPVLAPTAKPNPFDAIEACERIVHGMPMRPTIHHAGSQASYHPMLDYVRMPEREAFERPEGYYATLFHELGHATGHESRLNRDSLQKVAGFGTHEYSKEELVAEMTAAFLCAESGIDNVTLDNSKAYCKGWLTVLKNDARMVVSAAAQAQKAADFILNRKEEKHGE